MGCPPASIKQSTSRLKSLSYTVLHFPTTIRLFLCTLIVAAHTHCVLGHGAELVQQVQSARSVDLPIAEHPTCENESSCICKGATLTDTVQASLLDNSLTNFLPLDYPVPQFELIAVSVRAFQAWGRTRQTLSSTTARALLQSFLL